MMTFEEWWDRSKAGATPDTYKGWEHSCRQSWMAGQHAYAMDIAPMVSALWDLILDTDAGGRPHLFLVEEAKKLVEKVLVPNVHGEWLINAQLKP